MGFEIARPANGIRTAEVFTMGELSWPINASLIVRYAAMHRQNTWQSQLLLAEIMTPLEVEEWIDQTADPQSD